MTAEPTAPAAPPKATADGDRVKASPLARRLAEAQGIDLSGITQGGTYEVPVAGRYWSQFDRTNPLDASVREQAWTGTAHALIAELGVGSVTASALQMGLGIAALAAALGAVLLLAGIGIVWAARPETARVTEKATRPATVPAAI